MLAGINRRFKTASCLDLDYNSFKNEYFKCLNSQRDYQKEYIQRNMQALRSTQIYSREFQAYAKKKQQGHLSIHASSQKGEIVSNSSDQK